MPDRLPPGKGGGLGAGPHPQFGVLPGKEDGLGIPSVLDQLRNYPGILDIIFRRRVVIEFLALLDVHRINDNYPNSGFTQELSHWQPVVTGWLHPKYHVSLAVGLFKLTNPSQQC